MTTGARSGLRLCLGVVLLLSFGCERARRGERADELADETFQKHILDGTVCPGGPATVWAYGHAKDFLPAPAGVWSSGLRSEIPYVVTIPFWCEPDGRDGPPIKATATVDISLAEREPSVVRFAVHDDGVVTLGERVGAWIGVFVLSQLLMFFGIFGSAPLAQRSWLTGLVALPVGGYLAYRTFNSAGAVVVCLLIQSAVSAIFVSLASLLLRAYRRR